MIEDLRTADKTLKLLESMVIDDRTSYSNDALAALYGAIRKMKEVCLRLSEVRNHSRVAFTSGDFETQLRQFLELLGKIEKATNQRPAQVIFYALVDEVNELHSRIVLAPEELKEKDIIAEREFLAAELDSQRQMNIEVKKNLQKMRAAYEEIRAENEKQKNYYEHRAKNVEAAAETLTRAAENKTSKEWADEYGEYIQYESSYSAGERLRAIEWMSRLYSRLIRDRLFYDGKSYANLVAKSQAWRIVWMSFFVILAVVYLYYFWSYDFSDTNWVTFFLDKSKFIPIVLLIGVGFAHASKVLRINSHLLEQYKHRFVVAKTMHNLMTLENLSDESIKAELIQQGSKILFEFKSSGYMLKGDKDNLDINDFTKLLVDKVAK